MGGESLLQSPTGIDHDDSVPIRPEHLADYRSCAVSPFSCPARRVRRRRMQDAKVKGVTSDFARPPCVVADVGTDPELRTARAPRRCCGDPHGVALTNSKMVFPRPALLHPQNVNADLSYLPRKSCTTGRGCPRLTLGLLMRIKSEDMCRGDHQGSCRLAGCVNGGESRTIGSGRLSIASRTAKLRAVSFDEAVLSPSRGHWNTAWHWASDATCVRHGFGDLVASDPGGLGRSG